MRLRIIGGVSRDTGVSTRMLRDYEQVGLIRSLRREGSAYRVHGAEDIRRLGRIFGALMILALLKCHMPIRQIECTCGIRMWPPYRCAPALGQRGDRSAQHDPRGAPASDEADPPQPDVRLSSKPSKDFAVAGRIAVLSPPDQTLKGEPDMGPDQPGRPKAYSPRGRSHRQCDAGPGRGVPLSWGGQGGAHRGGRYRFKLESGLLRAKADIRRFGLTNPRSLRHILFLRWHTRCEWPFPCVLWYRNH